MPVATLGRGANHRSGAIHRSGAVNGKGLDPEVGASGLDEGNPRPSVGTARFAACEAWAVEVGRAEADDLDLVVTEREGMLERQARRPTAAFELEVRAGSGGRQDWDRLEDRLGRQAAGESGADRIRRVVESRDTRRCAGARCADRGERLVNRPQGPLVVPHAPSVLRATAARPRRSSLVPSDGCRGTILDARLPRTLGDS